MTTNSSKAFDTILDLEAPYISSPTSRSQYKHHPPPRQMTLSPNTIVTCRSIDDAFSQQEGDVSDHSTAVNAYLPSPHRSTITRSPSRFTVLTTPSRFFQSSSSPLEANRTPGSIISPCPTSPSVVLRDKLVDETRRLEQLQHNVLLVQQQSFALTGSRQNPKNVFSVRASTQSLSTGANSGKRHTHPFTTTIKSITPTRPNKLSILPTPPTSMHSLQSDRKLPRAFVQIPPPPPIFTTSTPLGSPTIPHQSIHPVFSTQLQKSQMSSISPPPTAIHNTPSGLIPSSSPIPPPPSTSKSTSTSTLPRTPSCGQQKALLRGVLNDIPKARLRNNNIIT